MAINPETRYPGKIDPSTPEYPYGKARNITIPGDGTGTPWEAALVNDLFGWQQALLNYGGTPPSGNPEEVGASQYLEVLKTEYNRILKASLGAEKALEYPEQTAIVSHAVLRDRGTGIAWALNNVPDSTITSLVGNVLTTSTGTYNLTPVEVRGVFDVASNMTFEDELRIVNGSIRPANGVEVRIGSSCKVTANSDWVDESLGGTVVFESGCIELRLPTKTTSPTGSFTVNWGWPGNTVDESSGASFVFGGSQSFPHTLGPTSQLCVIGGGYDNVVVNDAIASTICGGAHHIVADGASHSAIVGGSYQKSNSDYAFLGGGTQNTASAHYSVVCGGQDNEAGDPLEVSLDIRSSFVGAGAQNKATRLRSAVVGGLRNTASADQAFVGAGSGNTASADGAAVVGGTTNTASGTNSSVVGGTVNTASGLASVVGGSSNTAGDNYAVAFGEFTNAGAAASMTTGQRSKATLRGQRAHASGYFASQGDAQLSDLVARILTTGSQTKRLDLFGGTSAPILIPDNTTWFFKIYLVGRNIDNSENGAWSIEGAIKKDATSGSAALVGTPTTTVINAPTDWNPGSFPLVTAETSDGSLQVEVSTGVTVTDNIRWVARIELTEVAG